ncbi:lysine-sensitive aspartokinase 3 [Planctobacterium marinum]|uniref:Aspartokinase n=1 Tax=Planctobacterium marinum TaxID=1631968 RepID=A0AA48HWG0_9ALTE|nr:aspartate kinase [Planctobacterium marinum]
MESLSLVIAKFGGTSVANFEAMQNCVKIVTANPQCKLVVTSAPAGITNHLVELGKTPMPEEDKEVILDLIKQQVFDIHEQLVDKSSVKNKLDALFTGIQKVVYADGINESPMLQDELLSFGERLASVLLTACFVQAGADALEFDVREIMLTDDNFGSAVPELEQLAEKSEKQLKPLLGNHIIITQGFIGKTAWGDTTTLGRGGSDYTAALLSEALSANRCEIWTDVAGVFSTDPRIDDKAYPIPELSYDEAAEMANFGAKVLHPATLAPTLRNNIPVFVGSTRAPELGGTTIVKDCQFEPTFRAITRRKEQQLVTLHTPKMERSSQFIGKVFNILDQFGLSIDLITTSETFISLTFNAWHATNLAQASSRALAELEKICIVEVTPNLDLITIVGNNLHAKHGGAGKIFEVLETVRIRMISYGANPHNISFLVDQEDSTGVIRELHQHLLAENLNRPQS